MREPFRALLGIGPYLRGDVAPACEVVLSRSDFRNGSAVGTECRVSAGCKYVVDGIEYDGLDTGLREGFLTV